MIVQPWVALAGWVALGAAVAGSGALANGWRWEAKYNKLKADHTLELNDQIAERSAALESAALLGAQKRLELVRRIADINGELEHAKEINERYAVGIADGSVGLRVKASCPGMPGTEAGAGTSSGDPAGTARLDPVVGPDYIALRTGIAEQRALLKVCKAYAESNLRPESSVVRLPSYLPPAPPPL